jgi:hypothetical protein
MRTLTHSIELRGCLCPHRHACLQVHPQSLYECFLLRLKRRNTFTFSLLTALPGSRSEERTLWVLGRLSPACF